MYVYIYIYIYIYIFHIKVSQMFVLSFKLTTLFIKQKKPNRTVLFMFANLSKPFTGILVLYGTSTHHFITFICQTSMFCHMIFVHSKCIDSIYTNLDGLG